MVTQNGIYSIFGMQLRQNVLKSFQFATSLVHQVTGKYYQIGFLGVYEFYQFIDGLSSCRYVYPIVARYGNRQMLSEDWGGEIRYPSLQIC